MRFTDSAAEARRTDRLVQAYQEQAGDADLADREADRYERTVLERGWVR